MAADQPTKTCTKCKQSKVLTQFHRVAKNDIRRRSECKACHNERCRKTGQTEQRKQYKREWKAAYRKTEEYRVKLNEYLGTDKAKQHAATTWKRHGAKYNKLRRRRQQLECRARGAVHRAVARGDLLKPESCSGCGRSGIRIHAHHHDYKKPLDVAWLCQRCHVVEHGRIPHRSE